ncbi:MAG: OmpA family protein [Clostridia bacterium]|nr:OmpA family protein [Clostridia bacterium]
MGKPKAKVEKDTSERWLLTYADLMNLLLIFFIILYTMSQVDVAKFNQLAASLRAEFGNNATSSLIGDGGTNNSLINLEANAPANVVPSKLEEQQIEEVKKEVTEMIEKENLKGSVEVTIQERGAVISIMEKVLFKSGSAEIEQDSKPTVEKIGNILKSITSNQIKVEGHTDDDPIRTTQFPSNWELSSARATNVLRLLVDKAGINPKSISAVGYGEFRPKAENTSPENKAANRRVDIVIVKNKFDKAEAGMEKAAPKAEEPGKNNAKENEADSKKEEHKDKESADTAKETTAH